DDALVDNAHSNKNYTISITGPDVAHSLSIADPKATVLDTTNGDLRLDGGNGGLTIASGVFELWGGRLEASTIYVQSAGRLSTEGNYVNNLALSETIWNDGTIEVKTGALQISGIIGGAGTWQVDSDTTLIVSGLGTNAEHVLFANNNLDTGTLVIKSG